MTVCLQGGWKKRVLQQIRNQELGRKDPLKFFTIILFSGLHNQSIHQGSPLEWQVAVLGVPTPSVEWLKDGKPLAEAAGAPDSRISIFQDERGLHHLVGTYSNSPIQLTLSR